MQGVLRPELVIEVAAGLREAATRAWEFFAP